MRRSSMQAALVPQTEIWFSQKTWPGIVSVASEEIVIVLSDKDVVKVNRD